MKFRHTANRVLDLAPWLVLVLALCIFAFVDARIVSADNLLVTLLQAVPVALLGLSLFWVLLTGEIDLSAGSSVSLSAVTMGTLLSTGTGLGVSLVVGIGVCLLVGAINGFLVGALRIPSFIATLATMLMLQGATLMVARTGIIIVLDPTLRKFGAATMDAGVPPTLVFALIVGLLSAYLARQTSFGLKTYSVGSSAERAQLAGIKVGVQRFAVFLCASIYAFFTAVVMIARVPVVSPATGGISLLLDAIAAAVIGGTSLFGGKGTVAGVICGAIIISLLTAALRIMGVEPSSLDLYKGLIIVLILLSDRGFALLRSMTENVRA
ncbi:MAG TPA: ABC transporter permease [Pararobbsia sp.]|nr:ABC transporter permease [Pararobbsia sp.]